MPFQPSFSRPRRRLTGLAVTVGLHLALLFGWQQARQAHKQPDNADLDRIEWVDIAPPKPVKPAPSTPSRAPPAARAARTAVAAPPLPGPAQAEAITVPAAPATPSVAEILQRARKDLGKIDKDLQKEFPGAKIKAPPDSPQLRLERGIEHAAEMAPPRWYETPKVAELIDPGGTGHKRYRVITALGTYCVTYNSQGTLEKMTNCPKNEQPATTQKW